MPKPSSTDPWFFNALLKITDEKFKLDASDKTALETLLRRLVEKYMKDLDVLGFKEIPVPTGIFILDQFKRQLDKMGKDKPKPKPKPKDVLAAVKSILIPTLIVAAKLEEDDFAISLTCFTHLFIDDDSVADQFIRREELAYLIKEGKIARRTSKYHAIMEEMAMLDEALEPHEDTYKKALAWVRKLEREHLSALDYRVEIDDGRFLSIISKYCDRSDIQQLSKALKSVSIEYVNTQRFSDGIADLLVQSKPATKESPAAESPAAESPAAESPVAESPVAESPASPTFWGKRKEPADSTSGQVGLFEVDYAEANKAGAVDLLLKIIADPYWDSKGKSLIGKKLSRGIKKMRNYLEKNCDKDSEDILNALAGIASQRVSKPNKKRDEDVILLYWIIEDLKEGADIKERMKQLLDLAEKISETHSLSKKTPKR